MAPTQSTQRTTAKNGTRLLKPAISLRRPKKKDEGKHDEKIKCRTNPAGEPESNVENCSSDMPGKGDGISTIFGGGVGPGAGPGTGDGPTTSSVEGSNGVYSSRFMFIIPHVTSMKTIV